MMRIGRSATAAAESSGDALSTTVTSTHGSCAERFDAGPQDVAAVVRDDHGVDDHRRSSQRLALPEMSQAESLSSRGKSPVGPTSGGLGVFASDDLGGR